ncbi:hypothetical protein BH10CYA1_BH10CYA1_06970 [soil metagenome]
MNTDDSIRLEVQPERTSEDVLEPRKRRELQIALAEAESEFGERLVERDSQGMKACHERMAALEEQLHCLSKAVQDDDGASVSSTADRLVASLEASMSSSELPPLRYAERLGVPSSVVAGAEPVTPLVMPLEALAGDVDPASARRSLVRAMEVASSRERLSVQKGGQFDSEMDAAFALKNMVEHTSSFMTLFLDPQAFIKNQLAQKTSPPVKSADQPTVPVRQQDSMPADSAARPSSSDQSSAVKSVEVHDRHQLAARLAGYSLYEILSVDETAPTDDIRTAYVTKLGLLQARANNGRKLEPWRLEEFKKALTKAEKVLTDTKTRRSYDLSLTGLHEFDYVDTAPMTPVLEQDFSPEIKLDMPKLLVFAGVLTNEELSRVEVSDYKSDIELADQLVKLNLITYEEYNAAVLARSLVEKGKLSLGQTRFAFQQMRNDSVRFIDTIVAEGWLSSSDLPRA